MINVENLKPFPKFCYTIGMIPTSYKESLTYEEQLMWFCSFLQDTVIPTLNNNGQAVEELQNLYIELTNYVDNYFENLDVQEEINTKLDEMAEDGTLTEIITAYLQISGVLAFNTVQDMKEATNLINGSFVQTYGFYNVGDKGNAKYKVRTITNDDIIDEMTIIELADDYLIAELVLEDEMNVKQFGAKGNGTNDDTLSIQCAINKVNKLFIPATDNYYKVTDNILLKSNQKIYGVGETSKILMPDNLSKTIFKLNNINNVIIENLKLCNESCQSGTTPDLLKNRIITTENVENFTIQNCLFENAYSKGIQIFKTKNFKYLNNHFKNATFDMLMLLPETENVLVDNSVFDTITSTYFNTYLFATCRVDTETYQFACKNITVQNSKFLNNPNWEGIDTHACIGFKCLNNYVENCKVGIMAEAGETQPVTTIETKMSNLEIVGNTLIGTGEGTGKFGIIAGSSQVTSIKLCENVNIENNNLENFGDNDNNGALTVIGIKNFTIQNNNIKNSFGAGLSLTCCYYGKIQNNTILESENYGIHCVAGVWLVDVLNNTIKNLSKTSLTRGIRAGTLTLLNILTNDIQASQFYSLKGTIMYGLINQNTDQIGKIGNYVKDVYGFIKYYCTNENIRPAKTETVTTLPLTATAGSKIVTGTNAMYNLCPGEEITIVGAGNTGSDLTTIICDFINKDTFIIKDQITTSVSNTNYKTTAGSWTQV